MTILAHAGGIPEALLVLGLPLAAVAVWQMVTRRRGRSSR